MAAGCKNPRAINFDPTANPGNTSCVYMLKNQGDCHWFDDYDELEDQSFTVSYSIIGGAWVFFHDYFPDMYFHTRLQLFNMKDTSVYKHHAGRPGLFHQLSNDPKKPFFIDVVFQSDKNMILETVNWMADFVNNETDQPFSTLTHITIWNSHQHTGKIALSKLQNFKELTARNTKGEWVFNDFRNVLLNKGVVFLGSLFEDYAVVTAQADITQPWYKKELLIDKWFCVRFEFDNETNSQVILHDTTVQALKSDR